MASWVVCPGCGLRHSARPDGVCPRCKQPVAAELAEAAPPPAGPVPGDRLPDVYDGSVPPTILRAEAPPAEVKAPLGARLAGAIMIVNGLALVAEAGLGLTASTKIGAASSSPPARLLFSFVMGALVLYGSTGAIKVTRVLIAISGVVLPAILIGQGELLMATLQVALSASLLLLLFGDAGRVRMGLAAALAGIYFTMEGAGLYGTVSGRFPLARLMMSGQLEPGPVAEVTGAQVQYRLTAPGRSWYLRTDASAHKDNALADRWLVRPDRDTHVMVIAETLPPDSVASMDRFRETVVGNMKKSGKNFTVVDEGPLTTALEAGYLIQAKSEVKGQPVKWLIGLYVHHPYIFQVLAFGNDRGFSDVEAEVRSIVTSLDL